MTLDEELARNDCPEASPFGTDMVGPMLMQFGDDAQKEFFLPRIVSLEHHWCQGYSEPNAGSDLASLQTRAVRDGDDYVVNGSKIWTSGAHYADWMFALVRTGADGKPQEGISFLLINMRSPGITVKPIIGIHGWHLFNQVFLDDVRVPAANLVGQENMGWTIAKSVLEHERLKLSRVPECHRRLARLKALAAVTKERGRPVAERDWFKLKLAALEVRLMALEASVLRFRQQALAGGRLGAETGRLKLRGSLLVQAFDNLTVDVAGPASLPYDHAAHHALVDDAPRPWNVATASARRFMGRGFSIAGGSSEIQHNQLAKQVLGL
jgi:acyl-CoA dehydrogenase